jgi:hypothetical protein
MDHQPGTLPLLYPLESLMNHSAFPHTKMTVISAGESSARSSVSTIHGLRKRHDVLSEISDS